MYKHVPNHRPVMKQPSARETNRPPRVASALGSLLAPEGRGSSEHTSEIPRPRRPGSSSGEFWWWMLCKFMMINDDWYDDWYGDNSSIFQLPEGYCERFNFYTTSGPFHAQFGLSQMIVGDPMPYAIQSKGKEPELTADPSSNTTKAPFHRQTGHEGSSVLHRPNCKPIPPVLQKEVIVGLPVGSGTENIRLDLQFANLPNSSNIYTSH